MSTVSRDRLRLAEGATGQGQHVTKLSRSVYSGRVAHLLREAIIEGALPAGSALPETRLAEELAVSRGPIRNALNVLEGEGLVATRPNGRMVVVGFGGDDVRDLMDVRHTLESRGVLAGLERGSAIEGVETAFEAFAQEGKSTERLVELDVAFHRALVDLAASRFLTCAWLAVAPVVQAVITIGNRRLGERDPRSHYARIVASHEVIVDALRAGDGAAVVALLQEQMAFTASMFEDAAQQS